MDFADFFGRFSIFKSRQFLFLFHVFSFLNLLSSLNDQQKEFNTNFQSSAIVL